MMDTNRAVILVTLLTTLCAAAGDAQAPTQTLPPPRQLTLESLGGADSFEFYCASCHGPAGKGDGPVGAALKTRPADLTSLARRNGGVFPRDQVRAFVSGAGRPVAAHGSSDMPIWGLLLRGLGDADARIALRLDNIVSHVESLQVPPVAAAENGGELFRTYCASCHGTTARGNGPLADRLRTTPPDLTKFTQRNGGVFPSERVYRIIEGRDEPSHGDRDMPVWGDAFKSSLGGWSPESVKRRIDAIVKYLGAIQERPAE